MNRTAPLTALAGLLLGSALTLLSPAPAGASTPVNVTGRASVLPGAVEPAVRGDSDESTISGNGRYVVFSSAARLVASDTDSREDVYLKDLLTDGVERISVTPDGSAPSDHSSAGAITPDGRFVAFWSWANNLVPGDNAGKADVFVRDRKTGTTERVSLTSAEQQPNGASPSTLDDTIDLSSDGRYVVFSSSATNLGPDADTLSDIFVRDRQAGTTTLVSVSTSGEVADHNSYGPSMSADGRYVAFESDSFELVSPDTNAGRDVFVRDRTANTTTRVSLHDNDTQAAGQSYHGSISDNGTKVAFTSGAKLTATDTNATTDVYVRDRSANSTTLISMGTDGVAAGASAHPRISGDGASVAFVSTSATALAGANGWEHIYVRKGATTTRASVSTAGAVATGESMNPSLSTDGKVVSFDSESPVLVTGDTGDTDVFTRRGVDLTPFATQTAFVQHQLQHFTGAQPSPAVTATVAAINRGASPEHSLVTLATSPSYAGKRAPLTRLYVAYFKRLPDLGGFQYWTGKLDGGMKLDQVSASFASSSEFKAKYGNTTNSQFVTLVYNNVLDRAPDAGGLSHWVNKLNQGMSRGTVMTNFSESSEGKRHFSPEVHAALFGTAMLGAMPSGSLLTAIVNAVESDSPEAGARVVLLSSQSAQAIA